MSNSFKTVLIALASIFVSPMNPRKTFNDDSIEELANNIAAQGLMQNLVVRPVGDGYEIVAGERRYRALKRLVERGDLKEGHKVACQVRDLSDAEALAAALTENQHRENVHPMEQAEGYLRLTQEPFNLTADEISVRTGAALSTVAVQLALADNLCATGRSLYVGGLITLEQARALTLMGKERQEEFLSEHIESHYEEDDYEHVPSEVAEVEGYKIHPDAQPDDKDGYWVPAEGAVPTVTVTIPDAAAIKRFALSAKIPVSRAAFPLENYIAEGGTLSGGMFAETEYFDNTELFKKLQRQHMNEMAKDFNKEGWWPYIEESEPSWKHFGARRERCVTLYMNASHEIIVKEFFGPKVREERDLIKNNVKVVGDQLVTAAPGAQEGTTVRQNKKRIRLEDRAFNLAAESQLMASFHTALQFLILSLVGQDGSRLRVDTFMGNAHDGYHDPRVTERLSAFRAEVEAAGADVHDVGNRDNDPLFRFGWGSASEARRVIEKVLEAKTNTELEELAHAFIVATMAPVNDGVLTAAHKHALRFNPDVAEFFTPDREYLEACSLTEIERDILPTLGRPVMAGKKKDMVAEIVISHRAAYAQYVPPSMRPEDAADPSPSETDEGEEVEGKLVEA